LWSFFTLFSKLFTDLFSHCFEVCQEWYNLSTSIFSFSFSLDFRRGLKRWILLFAICLLFFRWGPQVRRLSNIMPKYLVSLLTGIFMLFNLIQGQLPWRRVKVTWVDLLSFILINQFLHHASIRLVWCCRLCVAIEISSLVDNKAVSSAKVAKSVLGVSEIAAV